MSSRSTVESSTSAVIEAEDDDDLVLQDLGSFLKRSPDNRSLFDKSATAVPVAAIKALLGVVQRSKAETMMGLQDELKRAAESMIANFDSKRSHIALQSGCELFLKYVTRAFLELSDFEACRKLVIERGERFQMISLAARDRIARMGTDFVRNNTTILTHGWSRVVAAILMEASKTKHFDVIILEGRPDAGGVKAAQSYASESNIPITVVTDSAMAFILEKIDMVLVGAEGVLENGGVVNKVGTYALATCAQAAGKPFYVAAESYKFARLYPLHQSDIPQREEDLEFVDTTQSNAHIDLPNNVKVVNPVVDFTPARFITLLFTDLGVLTPSAVSDELIRLYQ